MNTNVGIKFISIKKVNRVKLSMEIALNSAIVVWPSQNTPSKITKIIETPLNQNGKS